MHETPARIESRIRRTGGKEVVYAPSVGDPVRTWGHLDIADEVALEEMGAGVEGVKYTLTVATGILPAVALRQRARLNIGGELLEVRQGGRTEDGALSRYFMAVPRGG